MSDCCDPISYRRFFNSKEAARRLKRYRKKGLDTRAADIVSYLDHRNIEGAEVLEVGGGVGAVQVELLKRGAGSATNIELSQGYEVAAEELSVEAGLESRMERRFGDFVEMAGDFDDADIVLLNRVVCCYPFMELMMGAAVAKTERFLALVVPRERLTNKVAIRLGNAFCLIRGIDFRAFVHSVDEIEKVATDSGLVPVHRSNDFIWQAIVFERAA